MFSAHNLIYLSRYFSLYLFNYLIPYKNRFVLSAPGKYVDALKSSFIFIYGSNVIVNSIVVGVCGSIISIVLCKSNIHCIYTLYIILL